MRYMVLASLALLCACQQKTAPATGLDCGPTRQKMAAEIKARIAALQHPPKQKLDDPFAYAQRTAIAEERRKLDAIQAKPAPITDPDALCRGIIEQEITAARGTGK